MANKILVRVKQGCRLHESGVLWVSGQTFWTFDNRLSSIADMVDVVKGVDPIPVTTTAMQQPAPPFQESPRMPQPDVAKLEPALVKVPISSVSPAPKPVVSRLTSPRELKKKDKR